MKTRKTFLGRAPVALACLFTVIGCGEDEASTSGSGGTTDEVGGAGVSTSGGGPASGGSATNGGTGTGGTGTGGAGRGGAGTGGAGIGGAGVGGTGSGGEIAGAPGLGGSGVGGLGLGGATTGGTDAGGTSTGGVGTGGLDNQGGLTEQGGVNNLGGGTLGGMDNQGGLVELGGDQNVGGGIPEAGTGNLGGSGGVAGDPYEATVVPTSDTTGNWTLDFPPYKLVVNAQRGATITEFSYNGENMIYPAEGSIFVPSPQSALPGWPPPDALIAEPYTAAAEGNVMTFTGSNATEINVSAKKRFWANAASGIVTLEYTLVNEATSAASWAPWEITRVPVGGTTFFPEGEAIDITQDDWFTLMDFETTAGITWLDHETLSGENLIFEHDGAEGWSAHADTIGATPLVFIKTFPDSPASALPDNQGEIQIWSNSSQMIEFEQQGTEQSLDAQGELTWTVHWQLVEVPAEVSLAVGSTDLVDFVRSKLVP